MLLPTDESSLQPSTVDQVRRGALGTGRVAPALWRIPGVAVGLDVAIGQVSGMTPEASQPGLRFLSSACQMVRAMLERGDFAPADTKGLLRFVPRWSEPSMRCLGALAELVPTAHLTTRFATQDDAVYAVTPRNEVVSFVGHALDCGASAFDAQHESAERLPREFWRTRPSPLLEVIRPENELEEGVPWGIRLRFRPIPKLSLHYSLESLQQHQRESLFPDALATEALHQVEAQMEQLVRAIPALRRAMNMAEGQASLNRQELDQVLDHLPMLEASGVEVTLPGLEQMERLAARVTLREIKGSESETRPWFDFDWRLAVGGQEVSEKEFESLSNAKSPLVDLGHATVLLSKKDRDALAAFKRRAASDGHKVSFFEALRLKLGGSTHLHGLALETLDAGPRLEALAAGLGGARSIEMRAQPPGFVGELRPYQARGHAWMYYLMDQGFGACLADDMGLGKTVQAISVVLDWRQNPNRRGVVLLVCPVSVLGNWRRELHRFSPELRVTMHHGKSRPRTVEEFGKSVSENDVVLTSYNLLHRDEEMLCAFSFEGLILDEAQNIKNPRTRQSRAARILDGNFRLVLTGTPLENRPLDLWSILDFLNEGLLGTQTNFLQTLEHPIIKQRSRSTASTLARLVRPFVLRRLKTDPEIIHDLPEKTEQVVAAGLTREQAVLYETVVRSGLDDVETAEGIQRRGAILTTLLRLKQVCNHPAHYQGDGSTLPARSGKLELLTEMLEEALDEGDRCLVFTQFKEMGTLLKTHIENTLSEKVLFLHGGVPQKDRETMVAEFQAVDGSGPKVFVLSLKAGGTGLNLTNANRVFHYDRWWNPAVEDQATDRAFRIGQLRNVFVHKFVCTGTLEERIQVMLERKREVATTLLGAGEGWLTELTNDELRRLLLLDRTEAMA